MTGAAWGFLVVAAVFAVGNWIAVARGQRALEYVCKPGTMAALIAVAIALDPRVDDVRAWFVTALVLSLLGDIFLMLPSDRFVAGLSAFLLGHIAYVVGLNRHGGSVAELASRPFQWLPSPRCWLRGSSVPRSPGGDRELVGPLVAYMGVIAAMVTCAVATGITLAVIGAVLFMASDSLIAETRFVGPRSWGAVAIMVTYHLGQAGLTLSLVD